MIYFQIRGAYNQPIPVSKRTGYYKFKSSANGEITFKVSRLVSSWPGNWSNMQQLKSFVEGYIGHCYKFLHQLGYSDVHIVLCDSYTEPGQFEFNDPQRELRNRCMASYLHPTKPVGLDRASQTITDSK